MGQNIAESGKTRLNVERSLNIFVYFPVTSKKCRVENFRDTKMLMASSDVYPGPQRFGRLRVTDLFPNFEQSICPQSRKAIATEFRNNETKTTMR